MTQNEFFNIIMDELKELPEIELQKIISFYKNKISSEISLGKSEEDVISGFGDPYLICMKYINHPLDTEINEEKKDTSSKINLKKASGDDTNKDISISNINYIDPIYINKNDTTDGGHYNFTESIKNDFKKSSPHVDKFLKICIIILSLIIFFPVITSILGIIIGILGVAVSLLAGSIGLLIGGTFTNLIGLPNIPQFIADFPYPAIVLFTLGSVCLSIFLILIFYYSCKLFFRLCSKILKFLRSKGGIFNE